MLNPTALWWRIPRIGIKAYLENSKHYLLGVILAPHSAIVLWPIPQGLF